MKHIKQEKGFTLIEVIIAVAIIGFLTKTGWDTYEQYNSKAIRSDAVVGLSLAANEMEKCASGQGNLYLVNGAIGVIACGINNPNTPKNYYTMAVSNVTATTYTITARRVTNNTGDTTCSNGGINFDLAINELGQYGIRLRDSGNPPVFGNTPQIRRCWNK